MKRALAFSLWFSTAAYAGFGYYSPVTVNTGQVPSTQMDFPVLISVTDARFKDVGHSGHVQSSSGFDIRPYSDSGISNPITGYELERYNATTGEVVIWVKRSSLADGNITYIAYGNSALTTDGSSTTTWSNSFLMVCHLKDGTTLSVADSSPANTGNTNHSATAVSGEIDGGAGLVSASSQYIATDSGFTITPTAITISAWVNGTTFASDYNSIINGFSGAEKWGVFVKSNGKIYTHVNATADVSYDGTGSHTLSAGTWYYITTTYDSSAGLIGYVNAASDHTAAANGNVNIGASCQSNIGRQGLTTSRFWNGSIDEVRVSSVARSADWITTEYNEAFPATFETLGAEAVAPNTATTNFFYLFP